jgi:Carboxypeptidase regulatory-like domain/PDZ domain
MAVHPSSRRRRWPWLVVLAVVAVAVLLFLLRRDTPTSVLAEAQAPSGRPPVSSSAPAPRTSAPSPQVDLAPRAEPVPALPPFTGRLVSAEDGRPVVGAEVTFLAPEGATSVRSGPDGRFRLVPSRPGPHQLAAVLAEGYVPFGPAWGQSPIRLLAPAPAGTPELVLTLDPEVRLSGRVEAADGGAPISGATVALRVPGAQPGLLNPERTWTTDAQGSFSGTAPPEAVVVARAPGFTPAAEPLRGSGRTRSVTLRLAALPAEGLSERTLTGRVVEPGDIPVPDAGVTRGAGRGRGRGPGAILPAPVTTDAQGRFRFEEVPSQVSWAQAAAGDLLSERVSIESGDAEVTLTVRPGGVLAGRVLHSDGRPATAFALQLVRLRRAEGTRTLSIVDPEGRFEVRGLGAGPWELQALAADSGPSERVRVELPNTPGGRVERDLRLRSGRRLVGVVRDANSRQPVAGARVAIEASPGEDSVLVRTGTFTGPDGRFELEGLSEAPVSVAVEAERYHRRIVTLPRTRTEVEVALRPVAADQAPATDLVGIGAVVNRSEDGLVLGNLVASGGAAAAGLHPGDVVLRIDGQPIAELGFTEAISRLRGEEGTVVRLEVRRTDGTTATVDVVRRPISF